MKKIVLGIVLILGLSSIANASHTYECKRYVNGNYEGWKSQKADSKEEARILAYEWWKANGYSVDSVKCDY